jgi:hypothetical protein
MSAFRVFLVAAWASLIAYTALVISRHGWDFLNVFFGDMARIGWAGQFNADFLLMLAISALWVAWRHAFSAGGLALAGVAFFGGAGFLYPYLVYLTVVEKGDMGAVLLGARRDRP